ncbi:MAG: ribokinase [Paracoccaceae bacterium]|jgi:ribokinase
MAIYNLGSINADWSYRVPHFPQAGETLAATHATIGLGGKGANQSVAAARAGSKVYHLGCMGKDAQWMRDVLSGYGVDTSHVVMDPDVPGGHAMIFVTPDAENQIVIFAGANGLIDPDHVRNLLATAGSQDMLLLQNETNGVPEAAVAARDFGLRVVYSASPFDVAAVRAVLPFVTLLILNAVEAMQLTQEMGCGLHDLPVSEVLVTRGKKGATWSNLETGETLSVNAPEVEAVDTTGAGDTFAGYFCASRDQGDTVDVALAKAAAAAALQVGRQGTASAIPDYVEVETFMKMRD